MKSKSRIHLMIIFLILASLGCGVSDITGPTASSDDPDALDTAVAQSLAETASMQTAIAQGVGGSGNPTQGGAVGVPTIQGQPTTQLPTVSPTTDKAMVSVSQATNCRSGPGTTYDWLGALNPGQEVEILGKDPSGSSFYIQNPTNPSGFCWIWNTYATVTGSTAAVPRYTPMPTPTPAKTATPTKVPVDFSVSFSEVAFCSSWYIEFTIVNTGSSNWQSYQTTVTDTVTTSTEVYQNDIFMDYDSVCTVSLTQNDLTPGETGNASSDAFFVNPAGHPMTATIKVCSADGLGGTCLSKSITFTP